MLLISPGTTFQIIIAIIFSLCFIKIYERFSPLNDEAASASKNIAQWQFFVIFFVILLIKTDSMEGFSGGSTAAILIFVLFANLLHDLLLFMYEIIYGNRNADASRSLSISFNWRHYFKSSNTISGDDFSPTVVAVQMSVKSPLRNENLSRDSDFF